MLPLFDENPVSRPSIMTYVIIIACIAVFFGAQGQASEQATIVVNSEELTVDSDTSFALEWAAIPCEIVSNEPLSGKEVQLTFEANDPDACIKTAEKNLAFPNKNIWLSMVTSMFLHGSILHLASNMWIFRIFGNNIEDRTGSILFTLIYLGGGVLATVGHILANPDSTIPVVGASGAIAAIMGAYLVWHPDAPIRTLLFYTLWDVRAKWFLSFWFLFQFVYIFQENSGVAWIAHVAGFIFGVLFGIAFRKADGSLTGPAGKGPLRHPSDLLHPDEAEYNFAPPPK